MMIPAERRDEVWQRMAAAASGYISLAEFEQWLYATPKLEGILGVNCYLALTSFDYRQVHADEQFRDYIRNLYDSARRGRMLDDAAVWLAGQFLQGKRDLPSTARGLAHLKHEGSLAVPDEFVSIDSELDGYPAQAEHLWDAPALTRVKKEWAPLLQALHEDAVSAAHELLERLGATEPGV